MTTATITYLGGLRTECTHTRSGTKILTDAPVDNHGKGEAFSPTDLVCTSLAACMFTIMGLKAESENISLEGATASVTKVMADHPRRISEIHIEFHFNNHSLTEKQQQILETVARNCPVTKSLHPDIKHHITFHW